MITAPAPAIPRGALRTMEKVGLVAVMALMGIGTLLVVSVAVVSIVLAANGSTFLSLPAATPLDSARQPGSNVTEAQFDSFSMTVHGVSQRETEGLV